MTLSEQGGTLGATGVENRGEKSAIRQSGDGRRQISHQSIHRPSFSVPCE